MSESSKKGKQKKKKAKPKTAKKKKLTPKENCFIDQYILLNNGAKAAIAAKYAEGSARQTAFKLLTKDYIQEEIEKRREKLAKQTGINQERVMKEYERLAFSNISDFVSFGDNGITLKDIDSLPEDQKRCIEMVSESPGQYGSTLKFKLYDKKGALDSISKTLGLFKDKVEHSVDEKLTDSANRIAELVKKKRIRESGDK